MTIRRPIVLISGQPRELPTGDKLPADAETRIFSLSDAAAIVGSARWYPDRDVTLDAVYFALGEASPSSSTVIDVKKNGVSIFTGTYPTVAAGQYKSTIISGLSVTLSSMDYLTVDVTSGSDGKYLTVVIVFR